MKPLAVSWQSHPAGALSFCPSIATLPAWQPPPPAAKLVPQAGTQKGQAKEESDKALVGTDPSSQWGDRGPSEMTPSLAPQRPQQGTAGTTVVLGGQKKVVGHGGRWQEPLRSCGPPQVTEWEEEKV